MKRIQERPYIARVDMIDLAGLDTDCLNDGRAECPFCRDLQFKGGSGGSYWLGFMTLEDATSYRVIGHVRHQLLDNSDGRYVAVFDALDAAEESNRLASERLNEATKALYDALPPWEETQ